MNIRDIEYILSAAELKNFAAAARACHISQPSLSIQIKKVEQELGQPLFIREQRGVRLSPFGEEVLPRFTDIQKSLNAISSRAKAAGKLAAQNISLGAISTVAPYIFPHIKDLEGVVMEESVTTDLVKKLLDDRIDAALLALPVRIPFLHSRKLYREPFYLAGAKHNRQLNRIDLDAGEFPKGCRFLVLSEEHCMGEQTINLCRLETYRKNEIFKATSLETLRQMTAAGKDVTLIPALAKRKNDGLKYRALPEKYYREIGLVYKEKNPCLLQIQGLYEHLRMLRLF